MEVEGRVVVVTGGASGIGRSMCRAFAARRAGAVVVADQDRAGADRVAAELSRAGASSMALTCDVADESSVMSLVEGTEEAYGPVGIFCANAGISMVGGIEVPDEQWQRMWAVNVQSHVYAARAVVPGMVERGGGYLVHTASAAGLLTELSSAPYSVTKHAVVALAEWLSITHGDAGIRVSCLCPQGVWTGMTGAGDREHRQMAEATAGRDGMLEPEVVAEAVLEAMAEERFLVLPHPEVADYERRRAGDRERWLRGMRTLQAQTFGPAGATSSGG
jgi:NAD(P)-dependent dehydrogenase (short-subunit alcohol dehydrogenase family)